MAHPRTVRALLATPLILGVWLPAAAIRFEWTPKEIECAWTVGVDLELGGVDPGSEGYVRKLAWLADLAVEGTVTDIQYDLHGAYHTRVLIDPGPIFKGRLPKGPLTVALISGPSYSPAFGRILELSRGHEPEFERGDSLLLFLTKGHMETPSPDGPSYDLPENFFCLVNEAKLLVDGETVQLSGWGEGKYRLATSRAEIRKVVEAQSKECRED